MTEDDYKAEISRLTKERDFARESVVQKCRQYDDDMITMRDALGREIKLVERLRAAFVEAARLLTLEQLQGLSKESVEVLADLGLIGGDPTPRVPS